MVQGLFHLCSVYLAFSCVVRCVPAFVHVFHLVLWVASSATTLIRVGLDRSGLFLVVRFILWVESPTLVFCAHSFRYWYCSVYMMIDFRTVLTYPMV